MNNGLLSHTGVRGRSECWTNVWSRIVGRHIVEFNVSTLYRVRESRGDLE